MFDLLEFDCLAKCQSVCWKWKQVISGSPTLAPKADFHKAVYLFNQKAQLGVDFVTKSIGMIPDAPDDIARFLCFPQLDRQQVGMYLGEKCNKDVLRAVLATQDFCGMHLDDGLRKCLANYRPVQTTSGMRRILKAFAVRFCDCNPHYFSECADEASETAYLLCFAMMMLNTDAHNSRVQTKMTRQQFVAYISSSLHLRVNIAYLE
eukprot:TRINITY_DN8058_c1_g1_i2.p1 TRINITY_DN8058_c1_g1~~TRINITY_DN8058_c1_g1_i2.p1  ORF type:complete len:206 (+),score=28.03 TRINITY_DN8058_c1_g1_i2:85-702(+)